MIKLGLLKNRYLIHTSQLISIANILISIYFGEQMSKDARDVKSDQNTEFNIKRRCCKVCWDEACDIEDGRKIMTQWNTEDIEAAKLEDQEIAEAVLLETQLLT